jgi:hypothetical protein
VTPPSDVALRRPDNRAAPTTAGRPAAAQRAPGPPTPPPPGDDALRRRAGRCSASMSRTATQDGRPALQRRPRAAGALDDPDRAYGQFHGIQIATEADGVWTYESGDFIYLRWRITDIHHNQPARFSSVSARALQRRHDRGAPGRRRIGVGFGLRLAANMGLMNGHLPPRQPGRRACRWCTTSRSHARSCTE